MTSLMTRWGRPMLAQAAGTALTALVSVALMLWLARVLGTARFGELVSVLGLATVLLLGIEGGWPALLYRENARQQTPVAGRVQVPPAALWHVSMATAGLVLLGWLWQGPPLAAALMCMGTVALMNLVSGLWRGAGLFVQEAAWQLAGRLVSALLIVLFMAWVSPSVTAYFLAWTLGLGLVLGTWGRQALTWPRWPGWPQWRAQWRQLAPLLGLSTAGAWLLKGDMVLLWLAGVSGTPLSWYGAGSRMVELALLAWAPVLNVLLHRYGRDSALQPWGWYGVGFIAGTLLWGLSLLVGPAGLETLFGAGFGPAAAWLPWVLAPLPFTLSAMALGPWLLAHQQERAALALMGVAGVMLCFVWPLSRILPVEQLALAVVLAHAVWSLGCAWWCWRHRPSAQVPAARHWVLYDFMQVAGGAERVLVALLQGWPQARALVSRVETPARAVMTGLDTRVQAAASPASAVLGRVMQAIWTFSGRRSELAHAEVVIYSGFYAPLAVHGQRQGRRIYYCHTPPRFVFGEQAFFRARYPWWARPLFDVFAAWLRRRYVRAVQAMDVVLANSECVRERLARDVGVQAQVVYPPVQTTRFAWKADGDYYLSVARLEPLKRVAWVVQAFRRMPQHRLVVTSGGAELEVLKQMAADAPNIHFTGWVDEGTLQDLVGRCRAVVYVPRDEDFGMSPVEAMAAGKPVLGVAEGGLLETVVHGQTGWLVPGDEDPQTLVQGVEKLEALNPPALREACEARARHFDEAVFMARIRPWLT